MHNVTKKILKMRRSRGTAEGNLSKWLRVFVAERPETKTPECGIACVTIETKFELKVHWKALDEIYKICMLLHRSDLNISENFVKLIRIFRQNFAENRYF